MDFRKNNSPRSCQPESNTGGSRTKVFWLLAWYFSHSTMLLYIPSASFSLDSFLKHDPRDAAVKFLFYLLPSLLSFSSPQAFLITFRDPISSSYTWGSQYLLSCLPFSAFFPSTSKQPLTRGSKTTRTRKTNGNEPSGLDTRNNWFHTQSCSPMFTEVFFTVIKEQKYSNVQQLING